MKTNKILFLAPLVSLLLFTAAKMNHPTSEKDKLLVDVIMNGLSEVHFAKVEINDEFSKKAYDLFLERMDYNKRFFTQEDINAFTAYTYKIDDQIQAREFALFDLVAARYEARVKEAEQYFTEILAQPFSFDKPETFQTDPEKLAFAKDKNELRERWRLSLKFQVLDEYADLVKKGKEDLKAGKIQTAPSNDSLERKARNKILDNHVKWMKRLAKNERKDYLEIYLNAITGVYDPHTNYFSPADKENFDIGMSGKLEGIGAQLREDDGYTKVTNIVPGSPSWKQGELKENDIILKVAQGDGDWVDVFDMRLDDVVKQIRGAKGTTVRLAFRKPDGTTKEISIVRDVVIMDEGYAKSIIVKDKKTNFKVGFIHLPKFYADFDDPKGRRCSADVKAEILKLKSEKVDGIVLDLRNNGGGSLNDVVDMAGYFIKDGPVVQVKSRTGKPYVYYDRDPKVEWDGPFVILVNGFSASASEIMAAAMQDYGRAVIVGDPTTFGKGTVQRFFQLDNAVNGQEVDQYKPLGEIKVTMQKFFRINGGSTQLRGVASDIVLPDTYNYVPVGEKEEDNPMVWTEIEPTIFAPAKSLKNLDAVRNRSEARVKKNPVFQRIEEQALWVRDQREATTYSLAFDAYQAEQEAREKRAKAYEDVFKDEPNLLILPANADLSLINGDEAHKARFDDWTKDLQKDPYLAEAMHIIQDLENNGVAERNKK